LFLRDLKLVNFRSYCEAAVTFGPGLNVVVGANATGKTNLLEGAFFALRGSSPRTHRDEKLIAWGEGFLRARVVADGLGDRPQEVEIAYAPGQGKRMRWDGLELTSLDEVRSRCQAFIFVPESLLLVKGSPARRRAHMDAFAASIDAPYAAALRDLQAVLRQRNAQLVSVKNGSAEASLEPWDAHFARAAVDLGRRRAHLVADLGPRFSGFAAALAPADERFALELVSQVEHLGFDEGGLRARLRERRPMEVQRGTTLLGPHRDDVRFLEVGGGDHDEPGEDAGAETLRAAGSGSAGSCGAVAVPRGGRDLRLFGSQGEQRAAVLALLLAEQALAAERRGELGPLFLDDVMSELDDARRRLLVATLAGAGQVIITTTNRRYFTDEELAAATVIELPLQARAGSRRQTP